jgi:hypothetical protein
MTGASVSESLRRSEAPAEAIAWAEPFGADLAAAWQACPNASWLVHLALTARVPFGAILAGVTEAHRSFRSALFGIPIHQIADADVAPPQLCELVATHAAEDYVEQAFRHAARELTAVEAELVALCRRSPDAARLEVLEAVRARMR